MSSNKKTYIRREIRADEADDEEEIYRNSRSKSRKHKDPDDYEEELLQHRSWNRYNSLPNVTNIQNTQDFHHFQVNGNTSSTKSPMHVKTGSDGIGIFQHAKVLKFIQS